MKDRWVYWMLLVFYGGGAVREVVTKLALESFSPGFVSSLTSMIAVLSVLLYFWIRRPRYRAAVEKENWSVGVLMWMVVLSVFTAGAVHFGNVSIDRVGPLSYKLVHVTVYPVSPSFLAFVLLRERMSRQVVISTVIALVGFYVFYAGQFANLALGWFGLFAGVVSSLSYAVSLLIIKHLLSQNIIPEKIVAARFLLLSLGTIFVMPATAMELTLRSGFLLLLLGVLGYAGLFTMFFYGVKDIPATTVNVFVASTPLFSAFFTWLLLPDVHFTALEMIGLWIIIFALGYMWFVKDETGCTLPTGGR